MIHAQHRTWADNIFHPYLRRLVKRHFATIQIYGKIPDIPTHLPILLLPNHSTWWDGFFVYLLNKQIFKRTAYLMMLEEKLSKYRFFSKIGAYSIDPNNRRSIIESLDYTVELLNQEKTLVAVFPQGELLPWHKRPLGYKRGVEWILRKHVEKIALLPLAIRTEFRGDKLPHAYLLFGDVNTYDIDTFPGMDWLEKTETALLDNIEERILHKENGKDLLAKKMRILCLQ